VNLAGLDCSTCMQQQVQRTTCLFGIAGAKQMQVRLVARGCETVLGDAASDAELFLTSEFLTRHVKTLDDNVQFYFLTWAAC